MIPLISVIAPVYNTEKFLPRFLDSVLNQNFKDFELILVIDASPDNSLDICKKYEQKDDRIKILNSDYNSGCPGSRMKGFEKALGKYVFFADSDDYLERNCLSALFEEAEKSGADVTGSDVFYEYENSSKKIKCHYEKSSEQLIKSILNNTFGCCGNYTKFIRRNFLINNEINFTPYIDMLEDRIFSVRLFLKNPRISYIPEPFYHYVQFNSGSITKNIDLKSIEQMKAAYFEIEKSIMENGKIKIFKKALNDLKCYIRYTVYFSGNNEVRGLSKALYRDTDLYLLCSKSVPKFHTRLIMFLDFKGLSFLSRLLKKSVFFLRSFK